MHQAMHPLLCTVHSVIPRAAFECTRCVLALADVHPAMCSGPVAILDNAEGLGTVLQDVHSRCVGPLCHSSASPSWLARAMYDIVSSRCGGATMVVTAFHFANESIGAARCVA